MSREGRVAGRAGGVLSSPPWPKEGWQPPRLTGWFVQRRLRWRMRRYAVFRAFLCYGCAGRYGCFRRYRCYSRFRLYTVGKLKRLIIDLTFAKISCNKIGLNARYIR